MSVKAPKVKSRKMMVKAAKASTGSKMEQMKMSGSGPMKKGKMMKMGKKM
jgi:hypothetical protein